MSSSALSEAEQRARTLLRSHLTRRQRNCYDRHGHFFAQAASGTWYRIGSDFEPAIYDVRGPRCHKRWKASLCIHFASDKNRGPRGPRVPFDIAIRDPETFYVNYGIPENPFTSDTRLPPTDMLYALLLFVRHDEQHLLETGNVTIWKRKERFRFGRRPSNARAAGISVTEWDAALACEGLSEVPPHLIPEEELGEYWIGMHSPYPRAA